MDKNRKTLQDIKEKQHIQSFGQIAKEANLQPEHWSLNYLKYYVSISHF